VGLLLAGLVLAVGTPLYVVYAVPGLAGYLLHPAILVGQAVPYLLCAGLWLPWRAPGAATTAVVLSGLLLLAGLLIYGPMVWDPAAQAGDMIGLLFIAIAIGTAAALLIASGVALLVLRLRQRAGPPGAGRGP
jgi:hypothetical protein